MRSRTTGAVTALLLALGLAGMLLPAGAAGAEPVPARFLEGVTRAFPALRSLDGQRLAHGELSQLVRGDRVESRLVFRFRDGSLYDETVVFAQREVLTLLAYRVVQRGPSFPETLEAEIDREREAYRVRYRADQDSPEEMLAGRFTLPPDAYNGMLSVVLKNLLPPAPRTVSLVAFTPRPRVVKLQLLPGAEDALTVAEVPMAAVRWIVRPQLGLLASLLVADVPDIRLWILPGEPPAFLRAEGPLYFMGPVWRIEPY